MNLTATYPFVIERDDIGGYCANGYFSAPGFQVLTCDKASIFYWEGVAKVTVSSLCWGDIQKCGRDEVALKELCLRIVHENMTPDTLLAAIKTAEENGRQAGRKEIQESMKSLLDLE